MDEGQIYLFSLTITDAEEMGERLFKNGCWSWNDAFMFKSTLSIKGLA